MVLQLGEGVCHEGFSEWGCVDICRVVAKRARVHGLEFGTVRVMRVMSLCQSPVRLDTPAGLDSCIKTLVSHFAAASWLNFLLLWEHGDACLGLYCNNVEARKHLLLAPKVGRCYSYITSSMFAVTRYLIKLPVLLTYYLLGTCR